MDNKKNSHGKHMFIMLLCCLIPFLLIIGIRFFNIGGGTLSRFAPVLFPILCMGMHFFMMKSMMAHSKDCCDNTDVSQSDQQ